MENDKWHCAHGPRCNPIHLGRPQRPRPKNKGGRHGFPGRWWPANLAAAGDEVQWEVVGEQASRANDRFWGGGEKGAHRAGSSMAEWICGRGKATASQSGGRWHGWNGRTGAPGLVEGHSGGTWLGRRSQRAGTDEGPGGGWSRQRWCSGWFLGGQSLPDGDDDALVKLIVEVVLHRLPSAATTASRVERQRSGRESEKQGQGAVEAEEVKRERGSQPHAHL
jgi:hypothetical protein